MRYTNRHFTYLLTLGLSLKNLVLFGLVYITDKYIINAGAGHAEERQTLWVASVTA